MGMNQIVPLILAKLEAQVLYCIYDIYERVSKEIICMMYSMCNIASLTLGGHPRPDRKYPSRYGS